MSDKLKKVTCIKDAVELAWLGASTNQEASNAMLKIMRNDANILRIMTEPHLERIAMDAVAISPDQSDKIKQTKRAQPWSRPVEPDNRVKYLAQANMRTLMDTRLPSGKRIGDEAEGDESKAFALYRSLQKSKGMKFP